MAYWIKAVSGMTGIPKNTLIAWERRYGLVEPKRAESGYRIYSAQDVALLRRVKGLLDEGYRISDAAKVVKRVPPALSPPQGSQHEPMVDGLEGVRDQVLVALLSFDRAAADQLLRKLLTVPFDTLLQQVFLPILHTTGARWEGGEVSVPQEHYVSGWIRDQILAMARSLEPAGAGAPEVICATPPGDHHEFGLLAVTFRLASRGYRTIYLGTDVPHGELLELVRLRRPALVAISAVLERDDFDLGAYGLSIVAAMGPEGRVVIGGRAAAAATSQSTDRLRIGAPVGLL